MKKLVLIGLVPVLVLMAMLASCAALAQEVEGARRWNRMVYLLEKTLLKVDAVTVTVEIDDATAARLEDLGGGKEKLEKGLDREMAVVVFESVDTMEAEWRFHVSFSKERFLKSTRETLEKARKAGYFDEATEQAMVEDLPEQFAWMSEDGIHEGDRMFQYLEGDRVRTRFIGVGGEQQVDSTRDGSERRAALLTSLFGEKSEFRKGLFESFYKIPE